MDQISIFDLTMRSLEIKNRIRLIELFAGYGSQAMALDEIGADYEHHKVVEFDKFAIQSYNAIHCTHFLQTDIREIRGQDLEIAETEKYTYLMTYSFPCTDLSVAGKMAGMKKGSGTRSGLLWEVERILAEIKAAGKELPQILFMENVPQVIAKANIKDFHSWQQYLESLGYMNYVQILNAKDYGTAQNRERCFMFSFLGDYNYKFPNPIPLNRTIKNYLEEQVDEKYYINTENAQKLIGELLRRGQLEEDTTSQNIEQIGNIMPTSKRKNPSTGRVYDINGICPTLLCVKGGNQEPMIVAMRGRNQEDPTSRKAGDSTEQRLEVNTKGVCNTLTSVQKDNLVLEKILIRQATTKGYIECAIGGVADLSFPDSKTRRGRVQDGGMTSPTLTASGDTNIYLIEWIWRIRKLTERECGRLMGVPEKYIDSILKTVSRSQAYKQFGNSIVVNVMVAMFSNLHIQNCPTWDEIKDKYT